MFQIKTGKTPIGLLTYLSIMSVCFIINLPGIAIAPMEGKLRAILDSPELKVQLLTTLPNFVIIPFVLLTGKLSLARHKIPWIVGSLLLYLLCAIGYLVLNSVEGLIIVSCLLGCANGILIPFAMGFVVNTFYGKYRTRHLGVKSAVSNLGVVIGSFAVGFLIEKDNWHIPFVVYLAVLLPLIFSFWLKDIPGLKGIVKGPDSSDSGKSTKTDQSVSDSQAKKENFEVSSSAKGREIDMGRVRGLIGNNVCFSFIAMAIIIYLPQRIENMGLLPSLSGEITAIFFLFVLIAGFVLLPFVRLFRHYTFFTIGIFLAVGLCLISFVPEKWALFMGSGLSGIAFGIFQPFIYDKTSYTVFNQKKAVVALSYVLTALYLAIAVEPFVITGICKLFHIADENYFVFRLSLYMALLYSVIALVFRKKFAFSVEKAYISEPADEM